MKRRKSVSLLLAGTTTVAMLTGPVQAAEAPSPQELAAARLQSEGLMRGDENGELHLEDGLTRAELACLISPIILNPEHVAWETDWYTRMCTTNFNDVPEWAQVAVGVCTSMGTMAGYGDGLFGPSDPVSPQMACTVMLRYLEQDGWTYDTACEKAAELGLAPAGSLEGDAITRGDMAMFVFGQAPAGFAQVETPYLNCTAVANLPANSSFVNIADVGGVYNGTWVQAISRWVTTVYGKPDPLPRTGY